MKHGKVLTYFGFTVISLLFLFSLIRDFSLLFQTPLAVGIDGYYYVLQVDSFVHHGQFYFQASTPIVLVFLAIIKFFVQDTVIAIKLGAIILHLLLSFGVYSLIKITTKNFWLGLIGVICLNLSNLHLYFISEFLSNLGALVFIVWAFVFLIYGVLNKKAKHFIIFALLCLLAIFSHRSALPLLILIGFTSGLAYFSLNEKLNFSKRLLLSIIAFLIFISPLILAQQTLFELPISFKSEFLSVPQIPFNQVALPESLALLLSLGITIFLCFYRSNQFVNKRVGIILLSISLFSIFLTLNPFLNHQTGFLGIFGRLLSLSYLQLAITIPLTLSILQISLESSLQAVPTALRWWTTRSSVDSERNSKCFRFFIYLYNSKSIAIIIGVIFALFLIWSFLSPLPMALRSESISKREQLVKRLAEIKNNLCESPLIIAPHGEQFVVTAITGIPSQQTSPLETKNNCVYWLIHPLENEVINLSESITTESFVLVEDRKLQPNLNKLSSEKLRELLKNNPHLRKIFGKSQVQNSHKTP